MERVTLRLPKRQLEQVEQLVEDGEYANKSAAIRAGVAAVLDEEYEPITPNARIPTQAEPYVPDGGRE